ncbi:MAG TPA: hypothetical protein VMH28_17645 [Candidatus Acidoferrales bacterium]|nr:hypothetical protein [Candidatus Acidoferrales bacterium]
MLFLIISLACFIVCAAVCAVTFAIDHFAAIWEPADIKNWHGRFSAWATNSRKLDIVQGLSGLAAAFACLTCIAAMYFVLTFVDVTGERRFALYITGGAAGDEGGGAGGRIREFWVTRKELSRIPMFEYVDSHRIVKGRVSSILPIGGGLEHVCVADDSQCGLADSSLGLKVGDSAYIRVGRLPSGQRRPPGWVITDREAQSLASTADFKIECK